MTLQNYSEPIHPSGATWSFDDWSPTSTMTVAPPQIATGGSVPTSCTAPSIFYTSSSEYVCVGSVYVPVVSSSGGGMTALTGDASASGTGSVPVVVHGINGVLLSSLGTGLMKNTTGTGAPSIAQPGTDYATPSQLPSTVSPVTHQWVSGYDASAHTFSLSQPSFGDLTGSVSQNQLPALPSSPNTNMVYAAPSCGSQTNCYPIKDDGQVVWESANWSAGSPNVNCPACTFTSADVGKIFFGTTASHFGYSFQLTSIVTCGQTTIASVTDSHDIVLSAPCADASGGDSPIIWGSDDSAPLASAWTAAVNSCSTLQLPGGNAEGNGPAVMLVQQAEFDTPAGNPSRATCSLGTEALRSGLGLRGVDISSTVIVPTPNFSFASCTYGLSGNGCFGSINDGGNLSDFTIWGGGNSAPTGGNNAVVMDLNAQVAVSPTSGNNAIHHVVLQGWGAGVTGIKIGVLIEGGTEVCDGLDEDGVGVIGVEVASGFNSCSQLQAYDNWFNNLAVVGLAPCFRRSAATMA